MKKIMIDEQEIEVVSFEPTMDDKYEKIITIKVSEDSTDFLTLKELLKDNTSTISYYENDKLMAEYDGYSNFECRYHNGIFLIDLRKGSLIEQVQVLLNANEKISRETNELKQENIKIKKSINTVVNDMDAIKDLSSSMDSDLLWNDIANAIQKGVNEV